MLAYLLIVQLTAFSPDLPNGETQRTIVSRDLTAASCETLKTAYPTHQTTLPNGALIVVGAVCEPASH